MFLANTVTFRGQVCFDTIGSGAINAISTQQKKIKQWKKKQ